MAHRFVLVTSIVFGCIGTYGAPIIKRSNHATLFHGKNPLQGVEIAGLFNPMESISPQLFEKASEEHGHTLHTYRDICNLLPQDKLDLLMEDHFATFITDHDLGLLKSAHIDTVRIPVTYSMFLPKENRTGNFPKGELRALDKLIERVSEHNMSVWLDLMATPKSRLGTLELYGDTLIPEAARQVVSYIAHKYDPSSVNAVLVHPDITFPSTPAGVPPLDPKSIKGTRHSQCKLYMEFASILNRNGHLLAIDTTHDLGWWVFMETLFSDPLVLVHSLPTGITSPRQQSISRLWRQIKEDVKYLKRMSRNVPIAVTWDASINACIRSDGSHDCSLEQQLYHARDREPGKSDDEVTLNDLTQDLANDILRELDKADIAAWFFRTAKIQRTGYPNRQTEEAKSLVKRREQEVIVSGNDFLAMYKYGIFSKTSLSLSARKRPGLLAPVALGLGAASAGALGWWCRDDIKQALADIIPTSEQKKSVLTILHIRKTQPWVDVKPAIIIPLSHKDPSQREESGLLGPASSDSIGSASPVDEHGSTSSHPGANIHNQPTAPLQQHSGSLNIPIRPGTASDPAWGITDRSNQQPVNDIIEFFETPSVPRALTDDGPLDLNNHGSVRASVEMFESPRISEMNSPIGKSPQNSMYLESGLSESYDREDVPYFRPLSEIEKDFEKKIIREQEWTRDIPVPRQVKPVSGPQDPATRHGKVLSVEEKELLAGMIPGVKGEEQRADVKKKTESEAPDTFQQVPVPDEGTKERGANDASKQPRIDEIPIAVAQQSIAQASPEKVAHPEPLTHVQHEQCTRPHAGTGGSLHLTSSFVLLREKTNVKKRPLGTSKAPGEPPRYPRPPGYHLIGGKNRRRMTIHAPRDKDMDPNHPSNLKKMKLKTDEYKPYLPPESKSMTKTRHPSAHEIIETQKGAFGKPKTFAAHTRESTHIHSSMESALNKLGLKHYSGPQSVIGQDPRKKYEDELWTEEQKEGNRALNQNFRINPENTDGDRQKGGRVHKMTNFWNNQERMAASQSPASAKSERRKSSGPLHDRMKSIRQAVQGSSVPEVTENEAGGIDVAEIESRSIMFNPTKAHQDAITQGSSDQNPEEIERKSSSKDASSTSENCQDSVTNYPKVCLKITNPNEPSIPKPADVEGPKVGKLESIWKDHEDENESSEDVSLSSELGKASLSDGPKAYQDAANPQKFSIPEQAVNKVGKVRKLKCFWDKQTNMHSSNDGVLLKEKPKDSGPDIDKVSFHQAAGSGQRPSNPDNNIEANNGRKEPFKTSTLVKSDDLLRKRTEALEAKITARTEPPQLDASQLSDS